MFFVYIHMYTYIYLNVCGDVYEHIYVYMYTCINICICVYVYRGVTLNVARPDMNNDATLGIMLY